MQLAILFTVCLASIALSSPSPQPLSKPVIPNNHFNVTISEEATSQILHKAQTYAAKFKIDAKTGAYTSMVFRNLDSKQPPVTAKCIPAKQWKGELDEFGQPKNRIERLFEYQDPPPIWPAPNCDYLLLKKGYSIEYFAVYGTMYSKPGEAVDSGFDIRVELKKDSQYLKEQVYVGTMIRDDQTGEWTSMLISEPFQKTSTLNSITAKCVDGRLIRIAGFTGTIHRDLGYSKTVFPKEACTVFNVNGEYYDVSVTALGPAMFRLGPRQ